MRARLENRDCVPFRPWMCSVRYFFSLFFFFPHDRAARASLDPTCRPCDIRVKLVLNAMRFFVENYFFFLSLSRPDEDTRNREQRKHRPNACRDDLIKFDYVN